MDTSQIVKSRYDLAVKNQQSRFDKFNSFDYIFHSRLKKHDPNIPSKVFNPILWSFIETIVTRMVAKNPVIAYKPRERSDEVQSEIMSELFSYWFDKAEAYPTITGWVKDALIYGTGILKVDWFTTSPRLVKSYDTDMEGNTIVDPETGKFATIETPVVDYDDPRIQNVNIYDFFVDPKATSMFDAKWVIHQYWADIEDLERENKEAERVGKVIYSKAGLRKLKAAESPSHPNQSYEEVRKQAVGFTNQEQDDKTIKRVKIWEMWENNRCVIIGDEAIVLRDEENYYWHGKKPFIRLVDSIVPHEFYGKGEIEPAEKMVHALNTVQNQRITNVNRILSPMWKARTNVDDDELQFIDNGVVHVTDMQDTEILTMPNVTGSAVQEQNLIIETIQRALGVTDYVQGVAGPAQTAKEVEVKTSQANARFAHKVRLLEEMGLKQLGEFIYQLYQQFVTKEKVIRVVGPEGEAFYQVKPADLVGEYDVIPEPESTLETDRNEQFTKLINLFPLLQPYIHREVIDPMTGQASATGFIDEKELIKMLINYSGERHPERLFGGETGANPSAIPAQIPGGAGFQPQATGPEFAGGEGIQRPAGIEGMETPLRPG